ncbi:similar to Saccharomyces cerevisiae YGR113W DAM1 Essential subunit of the Dam1 complex (aka DASH complex) [Maudiozyma saulgeensis]|uniref:DASH complex subunit DAM1 n=1 Tax=Maudiozyma saulgeensis TaxID=1789683 RepID=A0A1X7QX14_9SACH|nr:similar to Saccharomyces cerevisiae YGR113W DAM1 Essential subunit of the Dam1 complex (aka DASH complex) [Kazachstania saulgeensis]
MSEIKNNESSSRTGTEYKLSVSSNPGSRRSSIASINVNDNINGRTGNVNGGGFEKEGDQNVLQEYLVPQIRELTDSIVTLDSNLARLNTIHDNLIDLNESFGSLIYGILCTSACTDFPGVSLDIERELRAIKRVQTLQQERLQLEEQLHSLKTRSSLSTNNSKPSSGKFSEPLFPARGTTTNYRTYNVPRRRSTKNNNNPENENIYDDNNSEESFVLNPPVQKQVSSIGNPGYATKQRSMANSNSKQSGKLRRRSILHTIRNSLLVDDNVGNQRSNNNPRGSNNLERPSLGGLPTRNIDRTAQEGPRRNTFSAAFKNNESSRRVTKIRPQSKPKSINERPPFR